MRSRLANLQRFYQMCDALEQWVGGKRVLADCDGRTGWPDRGVYFFGEKGQVRPVSRKTSASGP